MEQAYGGMRGVKALVCDTSDVPPDKGLIVRGIPIAQLMGELPEDVLWLLLTGTLPAKAELDDLHAELRSRAAMPDYVWSVLTAMPADSHPMVMLNTAILVMERESVFRRRYDTGMKKDEYWVATLERRRSWHHPRRSSAYQPVLSLPTGGVEDGGRRPSASRARPAPVPPNRSA